MAKNSKVSAFLQEGRREWDVDKIYRHFSTVDAGAIVNTRIPQIGTKDRIAWVHTTNGQYSVKSAYFQWSQSHSIGEGITNSMGWKRLWLLPVPHKIRVFLWRFCRNTIPVRYRLSGKGIPVSISCPMCVRDVEHLRHLFFECKFAKECWQLVELDFESYDMEYVSTWLTHFLASAPLKDLVTMAAVLWGIWYARNKYIFENKNMPPAVVTSWSLKQVEDWQHANKRPTDVPSNREGSGRAVQKWEKPKEGQLKLNVDAAISGGQDFFSVGMVLRDHNGQFVAGKTMKFVGEVSVVEAETTGILEALVWASEVCADTITIETDSLVSVNAINQDQSCLLELGDLMQQCRELIRSADRLVLCHVKKQANKVAHHLARCPCEPNCFIVYSSPPSLLLETIMSDDLLS